MSGGDGGVFCAGWGGMLLLREEMWAKEHARARCEPTPSHLLFCGVLTRVCRARAAACRFERYFGKLQLFFSFFHFITIIFFNALCY